jgi:hypothetical protein
MRSARTRHEAIQLDGQGLESLISDVANRCTKTMERRLRSRYLNDKPIGLTWQFVRY